MEGMCSSPPWSKQVQQDSSESESTASEGEGRDQNRGHQNAMASLGLVPIDSDEMTGEASGEPKPHGTKACSSGSEESGVGYMQTAWGGGCHNRQSQNPNPSARMWVTQDNSARGENSRKVKILEKAANHREGHREPNETETVSQSESNPPSQNEPRVLIAVTMQQFIIANYRTLQCRVLL